MFKKKTKSIKFDRSDTELLLQVFLSINRLINDSSDDVCDRILFVSNHLSFLRHILGINLERGVIYEKILQQSKQSKR